MNHTASRFACLVATTALIACFVTCRASRGQDPDPVRSTQDVAAWGTTAPSAPVGKIPASFEVTPYGEATYTIPIVVPPGRKGIEPRLALKYASRGGDGHLGIRWQLTGLSAIKRVGKNVKDDGIRTRVQFNWNDQFELDGERLVLMSGEHGDEGAEYRTKKDSFTKVICHRDRGFGIVGFTAYRKDGSIYVYGADDRSSFVLEPAIVRAREGTPRAWLLKEIRDRSGNYVAFRYLRIVNPYVENWDGVVGEDVPGGPGGAAREDIEVVIDEIWYTGWRRIDAQDGTARSASQPSTFRPRCKVKFAYQEEPRADVRHGFLAGVRTRCSKLLQEIQVYCDVITETEAAGSSLSASERLVRSYRLRYGETEGPAISKNHLLSIQEFDGEGIAKPATYFTWQGVNVTDTYESIDDTGVELSRWIVPMDLNVDGFTDLVYLRKLSDDRTEVRVLLNGGHGAPGIANRRELDRSTGVTLDVHCGWFDFEFGLPMDYNLDGKMDLLLKVPLATWHCLINDGRGGFVLEDTTVSVGDGICWGDTVVADFNGDGLSDIITCHQGEREISPITSEIVYDWKFRPRTESGFGPVTTNLITFPRGVPVGTRRYQSKLILDANGDGVKDLLVAYYYFEEYLAISPVAEDGGAWLTNLPVYPFYHHGFRELPVRVGGRDTVLATIDERKLVLDYNGDGLDDVIWVPTLHEHVPGGVAPLLLGANLWINYGKELGFVGGRDGLNAFPGVRFWERYEEWAEHYLDFRPPWRIPATTLDWLNFRTAIVADMNGDGRDDIIVADMQQWYEEGVRHGSWGHHGKWRVLYSTGENVSFHPSGETTLGNAFTYTSEALDDSRDFDFILPERPADDEVAPAIGWFNPMVIENDGDLRPDILFMSGDLDSTDAPSQREFFESRTHLYVSHQASPSAEAPEVITEIRDGLVGVDPSDEVRWENTWTYKIDYRPTTDPSVYSHELEGLPAENGSWPALEPTSMLHYPRMYVVSRYQRDNGLGNRPFEYVYEYHDSRFDRYWGWLGFRQVVRQETHRNRRIDMMYEGIDDYVSPDMLIALGSQAYPHGYYPFLALVTKRWETTTLDGGNEHLRFSWNDYSVRWGPLEGPDALYKTWFPYLDVSGAEVKDRRAGDDAWRILSRRRVSFQDVDEFGNVGRKVISYPHSDTPMTTLSDTQLTTETEFRNDTDRWLIGLPKLIETTSTTRHDRKTRTVGFLYDDATGLLTARITEPGIPDDPDTSEDETEISEQWMKQSFTYHSYGLPASSVKVDDPHLEVPEDLAEPVDPDHVRDRMKYEYDAMDHTFLAARIDARGITRFLYDSAFGRKRAEQDPNGILTGWVYDGFGRLSSLHLPSGLVMETRYGTRSLVPGHTNLEITTESNTGRQLTVVADRLGRPILREANGFGGREVLQETRYNHLGIVGEQDLPHFEGDPTGYVRREFDNLGREVNFDHVAADGTSHQKFSMSYDGLIAETTDAKGHTKRIVRNEMGQIERVREGIDLDDETAEDEPREDESWVTYVYGPFSHLKRVTDALDNVTVIEMDAYGRQTSLNDPDTGQSTSTYNAFGELVTVTDGATDVSTFEYDTFSRLVRRIDEDGTYEWQYDRRFVGAVDRSVSPSGVEVEYYYNPTDGLINRVTTSLMDQTIVHRYEYDLGRPKRRLVEFAKRKSFGVIYDYDEAGFLTTASRIPDGIEGPSTASDVYFRLLDVNAAGRWRQYRYGNNVETTLAYDEVNGWLDEVRAEHVSTDMMLQHLSYDYEPNGNLVSRSDWLARSDSTDPVVEHFRYDALDRLVRCEVLHPHSSRIGEGWTSWTQIATADFAYDQIGRIRSKSGVGRYDYDSRPRRPDEPVRPHAVRSITAADDTVEEFGYDDMGNLVSRPGMRLEYTKFNKPKRLVNTVDGSVVELGYDATLGRSIKKVIKGGAMTTTLYVGDDYEQQITETADGASADKANKTVSHRFHVKVNGKVIATLEHDPQGEEPTVAGAPSLRPTASATTLHYHHFDHLGSINIITDDAGNQVGDRFFFDAFGQRREGHWLGDTKRTRHRFGFTGHEPDEDVTADLINMRGREYDARLGRFLSADPFVSRPFSTQGHDRYAYVANNPINLIDPSGFEAAQPASEAPSEPDHGECWDPRPFGDGDIDPWWTEIDQGPSCPEGPDGVGANEPASGDEVGNDDTHDSDVTPRSLQSNFDRWLEAIAWVNDRVQAGDTVWGWLGRQGLSQANQNRLGLLGALTTGAREYGSSHAATEEGRAAHGALAAGGSILVGRAHPVMGLLDLLLGGEIGDGTNSAAEGLVLIVEGNPMSIEAYLNDVQDGDEGVMVELANFNQAAWTGNREEIRQLYQRWEQQDRGWMRELAHYYFFRSIPDNFGRELGLSPLELSLRAIHRLRQGTDD